MKSYRKSTVTDVMINNTSCYPEEHKLVAYKNWIHRLLMLPQREGNKRKELNSIINIALNNEYKKDDTLKLYDRLIYQQNNQGNNSKPEQKWVIFIYMGNYISKITKLFKDANLMVAFKTTTVGKLLSDIHTTNTYEQSGIYNMTFQSCCGMSVFTDTHVML
jgi:hypothetical protein